MIRYHQIVIVSAPDPRPRITNGVRITELPEQSAAEVANAHLTIGHNISPSQIPARFRNGLRFFQLWLGQELAGTTWIIPGTHRYLSEFGWKLPIEPDHLWLRDIFIAPRFRGRRLFSSFLGLMLAQHWPRCPLMWSDVDWANAASRNAHAKAGFQLYARARAIGIGSRPFIRGSILPWFKPVTEIQPGRRVVWLRGENLTLHHELLA